MQFLGCIKKLVAGLSGSNTLDLAWSMVFCSYINRFYIFRDIFEMKLALESSLLPMVQSALLIGAPLSFGVYGCVWLQRNRLPLAMGRAYPDCFPLETRPHVACCIGAVALAD